MKDSKGIKSFISMKIDLKNPIPMTKELEDNWKAPYQGKPGFLIIDSKGNAKKIE